MSEHLTLLAEARTSGTASGSSWCWDGVNLCQTMKHRGDRSRPAATGHLPKTQRRLGKHGWALQPETAADVLPARRQFPAHRTVPMKTDDFRTIHAFLRPERCSASGAFACAMSKKPCAVLRRMALNGEAAWQGKAPRSVLPSVCTMKGSINGKQDPDLSNSLIR